MKEKIFNSTILRFALVGVANTIFGTAIMFAFYNIKEEDIEIKKGEAIGQAIFQKYLVVDNDNAEGERSGGFGSTNKI